MALTIFHISDLHIGASSVEVGARSLSRADFLKEYAVPCLIDHASSSKNSVFVVTGDIVDDGDKEQMKEARSVLRPLRKKSTVLYIPGNHDYGLNGIVAKKENLKIFEEIFYPKGGTVEFPIVTALEGHIFIGLDSMKMEVGFFSRFFADGELGEEQIDKTVKVLQGLQNGPKTNQTIVYLHHHPFLLPGESLGARLADRIGHGLNDSRKFMRAIKGKVDILLFGHEHFHLAMVGTDLNTQFGIPYMFSSSSLTVQTKEYPMNANCEAGSQPIHEGFVFRKVEIGDDGSVTHQTISVPVKSHP